MEVQRIWIEVHTKATDEEEEVEDWLDKNFPVKHGWMYHETNEMDDDDIVYQFYAY